MSPSPGQDGIERGYVIPIGGAEEKLSDPVILKKFVELCGGEKSRIIVIPTASQLDDTGPRYVA
ncbi:MAG: cyanophycinase, partial [Enterobacterales bacterium]|nr:cyanophycinase [Enterobacterales bacterium]